MLRGSRRATLQYVAVTIEQACEGPDKPSRALAACELFTNREEALGCSAMLRQSGGVSHRLAQVVLWDASKHADGGGKRINVGSEAALWHVDSAA